MGISITIDEKLIEEVRKLTGPASDQQLVEAVLARFIDGRRKHSSLLDHAGKFEFVEGFDPKDLR